MKRKILWICLFICLIMSGLILVADYYHAIFVTDKTAEEFENVLTEENIEVIQQEMPENTVKVCIFGDNLIHENILFDANLNAGGAGTREDFDKGFDFLPMYKEVEEYIHSADLSICNQASLVAANDSPKALSGYPLFNSPSQLGDDLIELGFDVINIANNHLLDQGDVGYDNSVAYWKSKDIFLAGGYQSEEEMSDPSNKVVEINGIKIGILSYTATTNGLYAESKNTAIPYFLFRESAILKKKLENDVAGVKAISDVVIVMMNWGNTSGTKISDQQRETAQILCDAGADVIVGTGPKVIQSMEYITSTVDEHKTLCAYSIGNSMGTMQYFENLLGGILFFDLKMEEGSLKLEHVRFMPTIIHYDSEIRGISLIPLSAYTLEQFELHGSNILYGATEFSALNNAVKAVISDEFLD